MTHEISCSHMDAMAFEAVINGHSLVMDADEASGGSNRGMRPKPLLLAGLAGCTGMDVVSLLQKMRVAFSDFSMNVEGDLSEEHPKVYEVIRLVYSIRMAEADREKMEKAVALSKEKYCGVSAMLGKGSKIELEIRYL